MTTRRQRHIKSPMTYRMPPDIEIGIDALVNEGKFVNRAEAMTALLRSGLDFRKFDLPTALREYLETDEGIALIKKAAGRRARKR